MTNNLIFSSASGDWSNAAIWVDGVVPGSTDQAIIDTNHIVTVSSPVQCYGFVLQGGSLVLNADMTITDMAKAGALNDQNIFIMDDSTNGLYSTNASSVNPRTIASSSAVPTNPFKWFVYSQTGPETRNINFDFIKFRGCYPFFGNEYCYATYNDPSNVNSTWIDDVTPIARESKLIEHAIIGRTHGRVYRMGEDAGTCVVSGHCTLDSHFPTLVRKMQEYGRRVALIWPWVAMPSARIEGTPRFTPKRGSLRVDWSITLVEDW